MSKEVRDRGFPLLVPGLRKLNGGWSLGSNDHPSFQTCRESNNLDGLVEELVELVDLGGDGQVNGLVTELDNQTTEDGGVDLMILQPRY